MTALLASLRWRNVRWAALAATIPVLWACTSHRLAQPEGSPSQTASNEFPQQINRNIDILFMVDNSLSMRPMQVKLNAQLPAFMQVLQTLPGGLPDLHIGVVSSSMGGGIYSDVPTCFPDTPVQDDGGKFQFAAHPAMGQTSCPTPNNGDHYIKANAAGTTNNFNNTGQNAIADVFTCMAFLGDGGCGFEQPEASVQRALEKASDPNDPDNGGFLRDDAYLAVIMLTNEDDCSIPGDSDLLATDQFDLSAPYGPLKSYRCNEFGHLCTYPDGHVDKPPRTLPNATATSGGDDVTMMKCVSAADNGGADNKLTKVQDFIDFLKGLKHDPKKVLVAVVGTMTPGAKDFPLAPYVVTATDNVVPDPSMPDPPRHEFWPSVKSGCTNADGSFGDPSPRHEMFVQAFGTNGVFASICDNTYQQSMVQIANTIGRVLRPPCVDPNVMNDANGNPDCQVGDVTFSDNGTPISKPVPWCNAGGWCGNNSCSQSDASSDKPCWLFGDPATSMCMGTDAGKVELHICRESTCDQTMRPTQESNATISCSLMN